MRQCSVWCIILAVEASNTMVNAQAGDLVAGSAAEQEAGRREVGEVSDKDETEDDREN